jgi:uncharacterized protein (DUF3084 family)
MVLWTLQLRQSEEKVISLSKEKEQLMKERDAAFQEAHMWRIELGKAREQAVIQKATIARAEEKARVSEADAAARIKEAAEKLHTVEEEKEELLALVAVLQSQVQRFVLTPATYMQLKCVISMEYSCICYTVMANDQSINSLMQRAEQHKASM